MKTIASKNDTMVSERQYNTYNYCATVVPKRKNMYEMLVVGLPDWKLKFAHGSEVAFPLKLLAIDE